MRRVFPRGGEGQGELRGQMTHIESTLGRQEGTILLYTRPGYITLHNTTEVTLHYTSLLQMTVLHCTKV